MRQVLIALFVVLCILAMTNAQTSPSISMTGTFVDFPPTYGNMRSSDDSDRRVVSLQLSSGTWVNPAASNFITTCYQALFQSRSTNYWSFGNNLSQLISTASITLSNSNTVATIQPLYWSDYGGITGLKSNEILDIVVPSLCTTNNVVINTQQSLTIVDSRAIYPMFFISGTWITTPPYRSDVRSMSGSKIFQLTITLNGGNPANPPIFGDLSNGNIVASLVSGLTGSSSASNAWNNQRTNAATYTASNCILTDAPQYGLCSQSVSNIASRSITLTLPPMPTYDADAGVSESITISVGSSAILNTGTAQGFPAAFTLGPISQKIYIQAPVATVSGTFVTSSHVSDQNIVAGLTSNQQPLTIVITLTGDYFTLNTDSQKAQLVSGITSSQQSTSGWNILRSSVISPNQVVASGTQSVTITIPSFGAAYSITSDETLTARVAETSVASGLSYDASPNLLISAAGTFTKNLQFVNSANGLNCSMFTLIFGMLVLSLMYVF